MAKKKSVPVEKKPVVSCPVCHDVKKIQLKLETARGKRFRCGKCGVPFRVAA